MNQQIVFASGHCGQTDIVELSESSFAALKGHLEPINRWNEKVTSKNIVSHLGVSPIK